MAFYRFQLRDPVEPVDGPGHDGAALADDIEATVFAAGIIQRMLLERPDLPRGWSLAISQDGRDVGALTLDQGCRFVLHWNGIPAATEHEGDVVLGPGVSRLRP
jgi:phosphoheptose isomerase